MSKSGVGRKRSCYKALTQDLTRDSIKYPGKVATYLLDVFVDGDGKIYKDHLIDRGIIKENGKTVFTQWRSDLIDKGWINFESNQKFTRYSPGRELLKHINTEKLKYHTIATIKQVHFITDGIADQLAELNKKFELHDKAIEMIIELLDPPCDPEKKNTYLKLAEMGNIQVPQQRKLELLKPDSPFPNPKKWSFRKE